MKFVDPNGAAGLRVVEAGSNDTVAITDNSTAGTTTVVANGQSQTFQQQFADFDLEMMGKKDTLTFNAVGPYTGRHVSILADLGTGENHFTFNPDLTPITAKSDVNLRVLGHNGNDFVNLGFGNILESRVNVAVQGIGGDSGPLNSTNPRDSITFGTKRAGIRNSSVDVNVALGTGNTSLLFNYGSDLGHLAGPAGTPDQPGDFGPSAFDVNIAASHRRQDVDSITLFANGEINTGSTLNWNTNLGAGNNKFNAIFDANLFQIDDDGGVFSPGPTPGSFAPHSGGAAHFNIFAGRGKDSISFQSINQAHTIELSGLFDINIHGGSANDDINVDFGGAGGFTDDDPFELAATNRDFRLRIDGGTGDDAIAVNLANAATATFIYDVAITGGSGHNAIAFAGANQGGTPSFGPADSVLIDGGFGMSDTEVSGNFPVQTANTAL
jgi:hypothetical protein